MRLLRRREAAPGTIYDGVEYTSRVVLPTEERSSRKRRRKTSLNRGYSRFRVARRRVSNGLLALLMAFTGLVVFAGPASANPIDRLVDSVQNLACIFPDHEGRRLGDDPYRAIGMVGNRGETGAAFNSAPHTAYEKYGMSGTDFSMYRGDKSLPDDDKMSRRGDCVQLANTLSHFWGNNAFQWTKATSAVTTFSYSLTNSLSSIVTETLEPVLVNVIEGGDGQKGLREAVWVPWLGIALMIAALWLAWKGIVKRESATFGAAALYMVFVVVSGYWYMYNTESVPEVAAMFTDGVSTSVAEGFAGVGNAGVRSQDICWLPVNASSSGSGGAFDGSGTSRVDDRNTRIVECKIWETTVLIPWSITQFGVPYNHPSLVTDKSIKIGNRTIDNASLALLQLDAQSRDASLLGDGAPENPEEAKLAAWDEVRDLVAETPHWETWRGSEMRGPLASVSTLAAICMGILIIVLSLTIVVFKVMRLILLFFAPLFFLAGIHPGAGRRAFEWYWKTILGTVVSEIALQFLLSVMIWLFMSVAGTSMPYAARIFMIIVCTVAGFFLMKKMTSMFGGGAMQMVKQGTAPVTKVGGVAAGAAVGVTAGAVAVPRVMKAAGGGRAGAAAAIRTIGKSGAEGALRSRYSRDPLSGAMMAARGGASAARTERARASSDYNRRMENEATAAQEQERANDPFAYAAEQENAQRQASAEDSRIRKFKDDPEFIKRFKAQRGMTPDEYLREKDKEEPQTPPRPQSAPKSQPRPSEQPRTDSEPKRPESSQTQESNPRPDSRSSAHESKAPGFAPPAENSGLRDEMDAVRRDQDDLRRKTHDAFLRSRRTEERQDATERRQEETDAALRRANTSGRRSGGLPPRTGR